MTPTDYAAEELENWEQALSHQHEVERQLATAFVDREHERAFELVRQVRILRTEADLLLAQAVKIKCSFRDHTIAHLAESTTWPGELPAGTAP